MDPELTPSPYLYYTIFCYFCNFLWVRFPHSQNRCSFFSNRLFFCRLHAKRYLIVLLLANGVLTPAHHFKKRFDISHSLFFIGFVWWMRTTQGRALSVVRARSEQSAEDFCKMNVICILMSGLVESLNLRCHPEFISGSCQNLVETPNL